MSALTSARNWRNGAAGEGFVLPRWLRRPVRMLQRLRPDDMVPPPLAMTTATAILFSATGLYGGAAGGHLDEAVQAVSSRTGFAITDVRVTGNRETSEIDVLQEVGLDGWTALVGFGVDAARQRIAELPWVESAAVRKVYPSTLEVRLVEREPFAIWQHGSELTIVERNGAVIAPFSGGRHTALPLIIGMGATEAAPAFIGEVERHPELAARVKAYIRVGDRRWDLRLENGVTVKLPEKGEDEAIAELVMLDREQGLLARDITAVDMRLSDRLIIALTPDAAEARAAALEERLDGRKPGARI